MSIREVFLTFAIVTLCFEPTMRADSNDIVQIQTL
jgi:hypothetical protein